MHIARITVAHIGLVGCAPAGNAGGHAVDPVLHRELHKLVREHGSADNAGIVVGKLSDGNRDARSETIVAQRVGHEGLCPGIIMALSVSTDLVMGITEPVGVVDRTRKE